MATKRILTIDATDRIARIANERIKAEIQEAFGDKAPYPTVSPAAVRIVLTVAQEILGVDTGTAGAEQG